MIQITHMNITDIPNLVAIEQAAQVEPWSEAAFLEEVGKPHSLVLVARLIDPLPEPERTARFRSTTLPQGPDGAAAGYICLWIVAGEAQVLNLAVHPLHRGQGVGRALLLNGLEIAVQRGAEKAFLEVRKSNAAARKLYEALGFEKTGERPNFYSVNREAAILMELRLDDRWMLTRDFAVPALSLIT